MANRIIPFVVNNTDGSIYTSATAPTVTVQYGSSAASALTPTKQGNCWYVTIDDTDDCCIFVSGTGIAPFGLTVLKTPAVLLNLDAAVSSRLAASDYIGPPTDYAKPSDIPTDYALESSVGVLPTLAEIEATTILAKKSDIPTDYATSAEIEALPAPLTSEQTIAAVEASTIGASADPWATKLPGIYPSGTAGKVLGSIYAAAITIASPLSDGRDLAIYSGADYIAADGTAIEILNEQWPDLTGAQVTWYIDDMPYAGSVISTTKVRLEMAAAQTSLISVGEHHMSCVAELTGLVVLYDGTVNVKDYTEGVMHS